jgi:hypothetical protein
MSSASSDPLRDGEAEVRHEIPRSWISRDELVARLRRAQADAGLRDDLAWLAGDTTDDLGPIR